MAVEISRNECKNYLLQFIPQQPNAEHSVPNSLRQLFDSWWKVCKIRYIEGAADSAKIVRIVQQRLQANPHALNAFDLSWFSAKELAQLHLNKETIHTILTHVGIDDSQKTTRYPRAFLEKQIILARLAIQADRDPPLVPPDQIMQVHHLPIGGDEVGQANEPDEEDSVTVVKVTKELLKKANILAKTLPSPQERRTHVTAHPAAITPGKLLATEFRNCLEITPPSVPAFNNVQALVKTLDYAKTKQAKILLEKLSLMAQLCLYELSSKHQELISDLMVDSYTAMEPDKNQTAELRQEIFRAYLVKHQRVQSVNGRYVALLEKLPKSMVVPTVAIEN